MFQFTVGWEALFSRLGTQCTKKILSANALKKRMSTTQPDWTQTWYSLWTRPNTTYEELKIRASSHSNSPYWTQGLRYRRRAVIKSSNAAFHVKTDDYDENQELEDYMEYPDESGVPLHSLINLWQVILMTADEILKEKYAMVTELIISTVEHSITDGIEVRFTSRREETPVRIIHLVEKHLLMLSSTDIWLPS